MSAVMNTIGVAFAYAVLALFAQNAIFTRGLGVSRLIQLVGDERTSSWWFALLLCVTQTLAAPLAYFAGSQIVDLPYRAQLRPLLYLACVAVVCIFESERCPIIIGSRPSLSLATIIDLSVIIASDIVPSILSCAYLMPSTKLSFCAISAPISPAELIAPLLIVSKFAQPFSSSSSASLAAFCITPIEHTA